MRGIFSLYLDRIILFSVLGSLAVTSYFGLRFRRNYVEKKDVKRQVSDNKFVNCTKGAQNKEEINRCYINMLNEIKKRGKK